MENASKALIIAGAILLSILIIAIGMYIYNSSQNSIATAGSQISSQEVQSFNQTWQMHEGEQTGTNVKSLISKLSANAKSNETEASRLIQLESEYAEGSTPDKAEPEVGNIKIADFNTARTHIQPRHTYYVELQQDGDTALINKIIIHYTKP